MNEKFVATNNPKIGELIRDVMSRVNLIVLNELAEKSAVVPDIKTVIMNEYAVTMQICSHILSETVTKIAQVTEASQSIISKTDMDKFAQMTNDEKKKWVIEKAKEHQREQRLSTSKDIPNLKDRFRNEWSKRK